MLIFILNVHQSSLVLVTKGKDGLNSGNVLELAGLTLASSFHVLSLYKNSCIIICMNNILYVNLHYQ